MLFESRRIDDPQIELRFAETQRVFNNRFWPGKALVITEKQPTTENPYGGTARQRPAVNL